MDDLLRTASLGPREGAGKMSKQTDHAFLMVGRQRGPDGGRGRVSGDGGRMTGDHGKLLSENRRDEAQSRTGLAHSMRCDGVTVLPSWCQPCDERSSLTQPREGKQRHRRKGGIVGARARVVGPTHGDGGVIAIGETDDQIRVCSLAQTHDGDALAAREDDGDG